MNGAIPDIRAASAGPPASCSSVGALIVPSAPWGGADADCATVAAQGMNGTRERRTRFVDRDRRRRSCDRVHRQVRIRPGPLHGADAAHRRRAERAARSRHAHPVRHRTHARSGDDVWRAVASRELQHGQPRAGRRNGARGARTAGVDASGVPISTVGRGRHCQRHSRSVEARELWRAGRRQEIRPRAQSERHAEAPQHWTVLGTSVKRLDLPALATGRFEFVHNVRVHGMLHGVSSGRRPWTRHLVSVDESSVQGMPGLVSVVVKKNFVGVVAEKPWQAVQAAAKLKATWSAGSGLPAQARSHDHLRKSPVRDSLTVDSGDVDGKLAARRASGEGHLSLPVPDARLDRQRVRRRRRAG